MRRNKILAAACASRALCARYRYRTLGLLDYVNSLKKFLSGPLRSLDKLCAKFQLLKFCGS